MQVLILPGLGNSGQTHWPSLWLEEIPFARRVEQQDWNRPRLNDWVDAGPRGHLKSDSNLGDWPEGRRYLEQLLLRHTTG